MSLLLQFLPLHLTAGVASSFATASSVLLMMYPLMLIWLDADKIAMVEGETGRADGVFERALTRELAGI